MARKTPLGRPGDPILPASLRAAWAGEALPQTVLKTAGAKRPLTYDQLTAAVHARIDDPTPLVEHVVATLQSRKEALARLRVNAEADPGTRILALDLSARSRNALADLGSAVLGDNLPRLTWGKLLAVPNLGVRSALEFAIAIESNGRSAAPEDGLSEASRGLLEQVLRAEWSSRLTLNDPRLGSLARRDRRTVRQAIEAALGDADDGDPKAGNRLVATIDAYADLANGLAEQRIEVQLRELVGLLLDLEPTRLSALASRLGLRGPALTLQEAGELAGITRERIRQLQVKVFDNLKRTPRLYLPAVERAIDVIRASAPIRLHEAERLLLKEGVSAGRLDLAHFVEEWMPRLDRDELALEEHQGDWWLARPELGSLESQLVGVGHMPAAIEDEALAEARRLARSVGIVSIKWVAETAGLPVDRDSLTSLRRLLKRTGPFRFVDRTWFWDPDVPDGRNRLQNILRKILSVATPADIDDVMGALDRVYRQGRLPLVPDPAAVLLFAAAHPAFGVDDSRIVTTEPLDPSEELAETERIFLEVLTTVPGGVLDRESLRRACDERGMAAATFGQYTSFSPILVSPARNMWAIRGRPVDDAILQRLAGFRPRRRRSAEVSESPNGDAVVSWSISSTEASVFAVPQSHASLLAGDYRATDVDGRAHGRIRVDWTGTSWGYTSFLREQRAARGDRLIATFSLKEHTSTLRLDRAIDLPWVGDVATCYLRGHGWAVRLHVDEDLLVGARWAVPPSLAEAAGLVDGASLPFRGDPVIAIRFATERGVVWGSSLDPVLRQLGARIGQRAFVEICSDWFDLDVVAQANPAGDPTAELFLTAGLRVGDASWGQLSRSLGGPSDGGRDSVESRLRERRDVVGLGLLQRARAAGPPSTAGAPQTPERWPEGWEYTADLGPDPGRYELIAGTVRVAVGVGRVGMLAPPGCLVDSRGVVWATAAAQPPSSPEIVRSDLEPDWVRWARAEHHARRASVSASTWSVAVAGNGWTYDDVQHEDLRAALEAVTPATATTDFSHRAAPMPTSAFAFRRIVNELRRDGLMTLASDPTGFRAEFAGGEFRVGPSLADLAC